MDKILLSSLIGVGSSAGTFIATKLLSRRKDKLDFESQLIDRVEELSIKYIELSEKFLALKEENQKLRAKIEYLEKTKCHE